MSSCRQRLDPVPGTFDQEDMRNFLNDQFRPFMDRFDKHLEADDKRFIAMTDAIHRISTSIEVGTSVQAALLAQSKRLFDGWVSKVTVVALVATPIVAVVAIIVAIFK